MWKTRIKISKILTNIHAGFVTALLGCVLTFAPLNAMAEITFVRGTCTEIGSIYTGTYTDLDTGMSTCRSSEYIYFRTSLGKVYRKSSCVCLTSQTPVYAYLSDIRSLCGGTAELQYVAQCNTSSGGSECTVASDCGTSDTTYTSFGQTGYLKKTTYTCSNGTCGSSTAYTCAFGYGGTASCRAIKNPLTGITTYTCSGCEKTCSSDSECTYTYTTTQNLYYITVGQKCRTKSGTTYKTCTNYTKSCGCIKGYYGEPYNNADTGVGCIGACTRCDIDPKTGIYGTTTGDGVGTEAKHCYIPSGKPFTDEKGSGTYSGACYDL